MNDNKKHYCICCNHEMKYFIYRDAFICENVHDNCDYNCGNEVLAPYIFTEHLLIKYSAMVLSGRANIFSYIKNNYTQIQIVHNYPKGDISSWIEEKIEFDYAFTKEQASSFIRRFNDNAIFK